MDIDIDIDVAIDIDIDVNIDVDIEIDVGIDMYIYGGLSCLAILPCGGWRAGRACCFLLHLRLYHSGVSRNQLVSQCAVESEGVLRPRLRWRGFGWD